MHKFKAWLLSGFMALLFVGGILFGGSEWVDFPWGQLIAAAMWVLLLLIVKTVERKHPNGPFNKI